MAVKLNCLLVLILDFNDHFLILGISGGKVFHQIKISVKYQVIDTLSWMQYCPKWPKLFILEVLSPNLFSLFSPQNILIEFKLGFLVLGDETSTTYLNLTLVSETNLVFVSETLNSENNLIGARWLFEKMHSNNIKNALWREILSAQIELLKWTDLINLLKAFILIAR